MSTSLHNYQTVDDRPKQPKAAIDTLRPARRAKIARAVILGIAIASTGAEIGAGVYALYWFLRQRRAESLSGESSALASAWELISPWSA